MGALTDVPLDLDGPQDPLSVINEACGVCRYVFRHSAWAAHIDMSMVCFQRHAGFDSPKLCSAAGYGFCRLFLSTLDTKDHEVIEKYGPWVIEMAVRGRLFSVDRRELACYLFLNPISGRHKRPPIYRNNLRLFGEVYHGVRHRPVGKAIGAGSLEPLETISQARSTLYRKTEDALYLAKDWLVKCETNHH